MRAAFKPANQLKKRGGGGGASGAGGRSQEKIYSIDSDQGSLLSAPFYQRESQGGEEHELYPPGHAHLGDAHLADAHLGDAPVLQLSATLLHHSHSADAELHSLKDRKYSTYTHTRYLHTHQVHLDRKSVV